MDVNVPVTAVRAIFARENGQGYAFETPAELTPEEAAQALEELNSEMDTPLSTKVADTKTSAKSKRDGKAKGKARKPHLKLVD